MVAYGEWTSHYHIMLPFMFLCVWPCSEDLSRLAARKYARVIQKLGFPVSRFLPIPSSLSFSVSPHLVPFCAQAKFTEFKIQNMVGSCDVKFPIRLEGLMHQHGQFARQAHQH